MQLARAGPKLVLLVDREGLFRPILARAASEVGIEVVYATTGAGVLRMAVEKRPNLIVMETGMPDMGGAQVLRHLRAIPQTTSIPVVIYLDRSDPEERASVLRLAADDYLEKPFDLRLLMRCLERHLFRAGGDTTALADTPPSAPHAIRRKV